MEENSLSIGTKVTLYVGSGDKTSELITEVPILSDIEQKQLETYKKRSGACGITLAPVVVDGNVLQLSTDVDPISASVTVSSEFFSLYIIKVSTIKLVWGMYYFVQIDKEKSKKINRRDAFRVPVCLSGSIQLQASNEKIPITVRNLSSTGIGFTVSSDACMTEGSRGIVEFYGENSEHFSLAVRAVRIASFDDKRTTIGCVLCSKSPSLDRYIVKKQTRNRNKV